MAKELTQQQIEEIVETTVAKLQQDGITDKEIVRKMVSDEIDKAKKSNEQQLRFMVEDLVREMNVSVDDDLNATDNSIIEDSETLDKISPIQEDVLKIPAKQTAAEVAKNYLDSNSEEHDHHNRKNKEDVKLQWSIRSDRNKLNSVDENKELKDWQKKFLKIMNTPMSIMDKLVKFFGKSFEPIFCIFIPVCVMIYPINYLAAAFLTSINAFVTWASYAVFLFLLMFLPKVASAVEFPILGIYVLCKSGLVRKISSAFADFIDPIGILTYHPGSINPNIPQTAFVSKYAILLGWATVFSAAIFLLFKIIFFVYLKLKQYRRRYMVRHHHKKRYVASLDKNSEVLM
jgi:hypothetical protein